MLFSTNRELEAAVQAVVEFAAGLDRGDTLLLTDIERIAKCDRYTGQWNSIVKKVRRAILLDRNIVMRPVVTVGYRLMEIDESARYCARHRQRQAIRRLTAGILEVEHGLPVGQLTLHQQQLRAIQIQQMQVERRQVRRGVRDQQAEIRKTETMPMANAG